MVVVKFLSSSVGAKWAMALSGVVLLLFVLVHMLGNLQLYLGQEAYNAYAAFLQGQVELLWAARLVLLTSVMVHLVSGWRLAWLNAQARAKPYAYRQFVRASVASRTMVLTSAVIAAFIVYHLAHFTVGVGNQHYHLIDGKGRHDVFSMLILEFRKPLIAGSYMVAMLCLAMHLAHGASSVLQTFGLGIGHNTLWTRLGTLYEVILVGNISFPLAAWLGWVEPATLAAASVGGM